MYRGDNKILPIALVAIVVIVAIIAVVAVGRALLNRGDPEPVDDRASRALVSTDADHSVRMTVRGPIVADEEFNSYQIEISPIGRRMTTYKGYQDQVVEDKRLSNSTGAYAEFTHALSKQGYTNKVVLKEDQEDLRGVCANGRLYTFEILQAQSVIQELWTSSCRGIGGPFKGNASQIRSLFLKQIPESTDQLRAINL